MTSRKMTLQRKVSTVPATRPSKAPGPSVQAPNKRSKRSKADVFEQELPERAVAADRLLPALSKLGKAAKPTAAYAKKMMSEIVKALARDPGTMVEVDLPVEPDGASYKGALRLVIDQLLKKGYYNIVYGAYDGSYESRTVLRDDNGFPYSWKGDTSGRYATKVERYEHHERHICFDVLGERRFDVDWETSERLCRGDSWRDFIQGRGRILKNANGMPL